MEHIFIFNIHDIIFTSWKF